MMKTGGLTGRDLATWAYECRLADLQERLAPYASTISRIAARGENDVKPEARSAPSIDHSILRNWMLRLCPMPLAALADSVILSRGFHAGKGNLTRAKRLLLLRLGIIFTATGTVALAVHGIHGRLPLWGTLALGIGLVVIGLPILVVGVRASLRKDERSGPS